MMAKKEIPFDPKIIEAEENLLIDYQFLLQERMSQKGVSQSDLAERAGISKARLSQILSDDANPTVKTFAGLFHALDERVHVSSAPVDEPRLQEALAVPEWEWVKTVRMDQPIDEDMVALMKNAVPSIERGSMASNDNYTRRRVQFVESELATALLEDEAA
jgi:transcriptional regulator with XRE-family HTH domain